MIQLETINKIYNSGKSSSVHALKNLSLCIQPGDMISITGPSGSGKSTLLHILSGIDTPTSGRYLFEDMDVSKMSDREKCRLRNQNIGIIMQDFGLLGHESVLRNVCLPQIIGHRYNRQTVEKARQMLAMVGLAELEKKPVNQLSGGQRQRVAIARALTIDAKILLADEPTGALDTQNTESLIALLRKLNQSGLAIVIVTHDPLVAAQCPTSYLIQDGVLSKK